MRLLRQLEFAFETKDALTPTPLPEGESDDEVAW
jgi:hypothetical protein